MDDLVVLILTLIIVVLGAIAQFKKKKPAPNNGSQQSNSQDFWDILTGEQEFVPEQPKITPEPEPMPAKQIPAEPMSQTPEYTFTAENEGVSDLTKAPDLTQQSLYSQEEDKKAKTDTEKFSLRKAIIYSEIINRKYT